MQIEKRINELPPFDYREIDDMVSCAKYAHILSVAFEIKLFEHLTIPKTMGQLSGETGLNARKLEKLCDLLAALKFLTRVGDRFSLSGTSKTFFLHDSKFQAVNLIKYSLKEASTSIDMAKMLKEEEDDHPQLVWTYEDLGWKALFEAPFMGGIQRTMKILVNLLDMSRIQSVLDLGGGPGSYSIAMAETFPEISSIVIADLPSIVENSTQDCLKEYRKSKIKSMPCDIRKDDIGSGYDLVFASNSLYMEKSAIVQILSKIHKSLNSGGYLVIKHVFLDKSSAFSTSLDLAMSLSSSEQNLHSITEFEDMLKEAGFEYKSIAETDDPVYRDAVMIAIKKSKMDNQ